MWSLAPAESAPLPGPLAYTQFDPLAPSGSASPGRVTPGMRHTERTSGCDTQPLDAAPNSNTGSSHRRGATHPRAA